MGARIEAPFARAPHFPSGTWRIPLEVLLLRYGYALLFAGVLVEGEAFLLGAGLLAHRGLLSLPLVVAVAVVANTLADLVYFALARRKGRAWLEGRYGAHRRFQRLVELVSRHGFPLLLLSRFAYGLRIAIPAACGALGMGVAMFAVTDVLAGLLWALAMAALAYATADALPLLFQVVERSELAFLAGLALAAAAIFGARRVHRLVREGRLGAADLHRLVPLLIGFTGALNLALAFWPSVSLTALESWLPLVVEERSRPLLLFSGLALLQVARNLSRGKALAWWVAVLALAVSMVSHLGSASGLHHAAAAGLLLAWLLVSRRRFRARTDSRSLRRAWLMAPVLGTIVVAYGAAGLSALHEQFDWHGAPSLWPEAVRAGLLVVEPRVEPQTERAARFLGSVEIAGWLARTYLLVLLLRPVIARRRLEAPKDAVEGAFRSWARRSLQSFALAGDKHHLLVADGRGLVAYAVRGSVALAAGDPLAPREELTRSLATYVEHCRGNGWTPCIYEASLETLVAGRSLGLKGFKMAEEAVVDLPAFSLAGGARASLRAMVNKATRLGLTVERYDRGGLSDAALDAQIEEISGDWLAGKRLGEMGYSVSRFSLHALDSARVFLCRDRERVVAFCTFKPYRGGQAVVLDLMRRRPDAASGTMDLLLARALQSLRGEGLVEASLAGAPLANVEAPRGLPERVTALAFRKLGAFYGYRSLFQFKKKFAPRWEGRYLLYPSHLDLPRVAWAMATVHTAPAVAIA